MKSSGYHILPVCKKRQCKLTYPEIRKFELIRVKKIQEVYEEMLSKE